MTHTQELPQSLQPLLGQANLSIGDLVTTPTGRQGTIVQPKFTLHLHYLILFDDGAVLWMLKEILQPAAQVLISPQKRKSKRSVRPISNEKPNS